LNDVGDLDEQVMIKACASIVLGELFTDLWGLTFSLRRELLFDLSKVVYLFQRIIQYEQSILDIPES
jgi:hypothetical protein